MEKFKVGDIVYSPLWKGKGTVTFVFDDQSLEIKTKDTSFQIIDVHGKVLGEGEVVIFKNPVKVVEKEDPYAIFESIIIRWVTTEADGCVHGFANKPHSGNYGWNDNAEPCAYLGTLPTTCENWKESLRELETPIKFELNF